MKRTTMKNTVLLSIVAVAAMATCSCQKDGFTSLDGEKKTHTVRVNASDLETKTGIVAVAGGYLSEWQKDDYITLYEHNTSDEFSDVSQYDSDALKPEDILDGKAAFTVELETAETSEDKYVYMASYGSWGYAYLNPWENSEDYIYKEWSEMFGHTGEYIAPHFLIETEFMQYQSPYAASFDPYADLMVSKPIETTGQLEGEVSLRFARLGTIVKITLEDLDEYEGMSVNRAEFVVGKSFSKSMRVVYDYVLEKYVHMEMKEPSSDIMPGHTVRFEIMPQETVINEDGTADLWIRTYAGELTDEFSIDLFIETDEGEVYLRRKVDLAKERRTIEFKEGGMTVFSVGGWGVADVEPVYDCKTEVNEDMDGFTATWEAVENAVGYEVYLYGYAGEWDENGEPEIKYEETPLTPVDNGDGTWTVSIESGLKSMNYVIYIRPIPAEGHCLIDDTYAYFEMKIGLPDVWYLYHDSFGNPTSCDPIEGTEDYIIDFSPGKIRFHQNLTRQYQEAWQALYASGPWYFYSTEPLGRWIHSIELYSKNDSHLNFKVYASSAPNEHTKEIEGVVIDVDEINEGSGSHHYEATHKLVRYTFPADEKYQYYTVCGDEAGTILTSQESHIYYFK